MKTLPSIEDYLEVIAGKRDPLTNTASSSHFWLTATKPLVSLARYDVGFLDSVTDSTLQGHSLTDKQAELAVKIVTKYRKQLHTHGIDIDPENLPPFRKSLRIVDRALRLWLENDRVCMKFPYNQAWIQQIRDLLKESQGGAKFDKEAKTWMFDLTEYNVNWAVTWAQANSFEITDDLKAIQDRIISVGNEHYAILLQRNTAGQLEILNADPSLLEYIAQQNIELTDQYLIQLADLSSVLGYSLDEQLWQEVEQQVGSDLVVFMRSRVYELHGDLEQIDRVVRYSQLVNRTPVVIYDPTPTSSLETYKRLLGDQIAVQANNRNTELSEGQVALWSHRVVRTLDVIPLLISHVGLIAGAEKQMMIQNSQKIIYFNQRLT